MPSADGTENAPVPSRQALFREVNERIRKLGDAFPPGGAGSAFLCECGREDCGRRVEITAEEFDALIERHGGCLLVSPEHTDMVEVVERTDRYLVLSGPR